MKLRFVQVSSILIFCLLLYFPGLGSIPFYDKGQPREGTVVWAIYDTGNWILPLRNGEVIPSKPPLFHWLAALVSKSVGTVDEFTVRFPSAFLATAGVLLTYIAGAYLWSPSAGLISALVLATSFEWWRAAVSARVDMTLAFTLLCFFLFFNFFYRSDRGQGKALLVGLLMGFAVLAKGPLGIIVPVLTVLTFLWLKRDISALKSLKPITVIAVCSIVAGSWYLLALAQGGASFVHRVVHENFESAVGIASHRKPVYYFVPALFLHMAPWSLLFPAVAAFLWRSRRRWAEEGLLYLLVWFGVVFVFFSIAAGKRAVYILPLYPAVALMFGAWSQRLNDESFAASRWLARGAGYLIGAVFILYGVIVFIHLAAVDLVEFARLFLRPRDQEILPVVARLLTKNRWSLFAWSVAAVVGGIVLGAAARRSTWNTMIGIVAALMGVSFVLIQNVFNRDLADSYTFKPFMGRVRIQVNNAPLYYCRSTDNGVLFYAHRNIPRFQSGILHGKHPFYLLVWDEEWNTIGTGSGLVLVDRSEAVDRDKKRHLMLVEVPEGARGDQRLDLCQSKKDALPEDEDTRLSLTSHPGRPRHSAGVPDAV